MATHLIHGNWDRNPVIALVFVVLLLSLVFGLMRS